MKFFCAVFFKIILFLAHHLKSQELCPYRPDECETCNYTDNFNPIIICQRENKTDTELLDKISLNTQLFYSNYSVYDEISIGNKNFKTLPNSIFRNIEIYNLRLVNNKIEYISKDTFNMIKSLSMLDLGLNMLKSIDNVIIRGTQYQIHYMTGLKSIYLDNNRISSIDELFFRNMIELTELSLANNQLVYISGRVFSGLFNLSWLSLSHNLIQYIEPNSFRDLVSLRELLLGNNKIKSIDDGAFAGLVNLVYLQLDNNFLESIAKSMFVGLESLKRLELDSNIIKNIEADAFIYLKNLTFLNLNENSISLTQNFFQYLTNIEGLYIEKNRIGLISSENCNYLRNIKKLSLLSNRIASVENAFSALEMSVEIVWLDLTENLLTKLDKFDFGVKFQNLETLILNDNKISTIERDTFKYMKKLKNLYLIQNNLLDIKNFTFSSLSLLKELDLSNNSISDLFRETFFGLANLSQLVLNQNYLTHLNDFVFYELSSLEKLQLKSNQIEFVSSNMFNCSNSSIIEINLSENRVKSLNFLQTCFGKLKKIDLSFNKIEKVERFSLKFLASLAHIDLSYNRIMIIEKLAFNYPNLIEIGLKNMSSSSQITFQLSLSDFSTNLKQLDLSFNKIEIFNSNASVLMPDLDNLNMESCFILGINKLPFESMPNLEYLFLSNNFLNLTQNESLFSSLSYLLTLSIKNVKLDSIGLIDARLLSNLIVADFSYNQIETIKAYYFKYSFKLRYLYLCCNIIEIVEEGAFDGLYEIFHFDISNNKIKLLRPFEFYSSAILQNLILSNNSIANLSQLSSNYLVNLFEFSFSYNSLETFDCEIYFNEINGLLYLYLDHNALKVVKNDSFELLYFLELLFINSNQLALVEAGAFKSLTNLNVLRMDDNQLEELDEYLFQNLFKLESLNLSSNRLKYLKNSTFSKLYDLIELDLSNNDLLILGPYSVSALEKLENLFLNGNECLRIDELGLFGLESIKNVYFSFEVLFNETNKENIKKSLSLAVAAVVMKRVYFKSINIIGTASKDGSIRNECDTILFFLKYNLFVNLKTDFEVVEFLRKCDQIKKLKN